MVIAHFILVHAFYGGFFGWLGVIGAIAPDLPGIVGHYRRLAGTSERWPFEGTWWSYMTTYAKECYGALHTIQAALLVCFAEIALRLVAGAVMCPFGGGPPVDEFTFVPMAGIGWMTHILTDWMTHHGDVGRLWGRETGRMWGINWWRTRWYWTEWSGLAVGTIVGIASGMDNVLVAAIAQVFR